MKSIMIKDKIIGEGKPCYIIAEMSANHAGSIEKCKKIVRKAKECGADCIKIQTYTPDTITIDCDNEYFTVKNEHGKAKIYIAFMVKRTHHGNGRPS